MPKEKDDATTNPAPPTKSATQDTKKTKVDKEVTPLESTDIADEVSEILESGEDEPNEAKPDRQPATLKQGRRGLVKKMQKDENDTGSTEVQIALLTGKINDLIKHLKEHNKDHDSRQGLLKMVGRRRRLLRFLHHGDPEKYEGLIKELNLRK